jgi:hypothetical protein
LYPWTYSFYFLFITKWEHILKLHELDRLFCQLYELTLTLTPLHRAS